jgi:hypothetical protein
LNYIIIYNIILYSRKQKKSTIYIKILTENNTPTIDIKIAKEETKTSTIDIKILKENTSTIDIKILQENTSTIDI